MEENSLVEVMPSLLLRLVESMTLILNRWPSIMLVRLGQLGSKDSLLDNDHVLWVEVDLGRLEGVDAGRLKVYCLLR